MSSKKLKIPSSARRHIKYETFSSFVSAARLRRVQAILGNQGNGKNLDGILCIAGIDSRYNEGMSELLHYLLFGFFDVRKKELESSGFSEEIIDDMMLFICQDRIEIYCNPINYHYLLPYVSHWPGVLFHCLSEDKYEVEEDDYAEEFKIHSIIAMTQNCSRVGVPFTGKGQGIKFDVMAIEKWPIIQAFALDEFGGGGFFSLKHEVIDVSDAIHHLHLYQDPVTVEVLLSEHLHLLHKQWDNMIKSVILALASKSVFLYNPKISEPLISYFNHGMVGHKGSPGQRPFVAFSKDTQAVKLKQLLAGEEVHVSDLIMNKPPEMEYMICRVVSPQCPLRCTRTYFFCHQYRNPVDGGLRVSSYYNTQLRYSVSVYLTMVQALLSAIEVYSETNSLIQAKKSVLSCLEEGTRQWDKGQLQSYFKKSSNIEFKVEIPDLGNKIVEDGQFMPFIKHASLILFDVPSPDGTASIGSLAFSDTFLDSRICLTGSNRTSVDYLVLTSTLPRIHIWTLPGPEDDNIKSSIPRLPVDDWGNPLATQEDIDIIAVWNALMPSHKMTVTAWEKGLTAHDDSFSSLYLHASFIKSISLYDGDSMSQVSLLIIELDPSPATMASLPPHMTIPDQWETDAAMRLVIAFNPHSKGHTKLYGEVLPVWKENDYLPKVERLEYLDCLTQEIHDYLQVKFTVSSKPPLAPNSFLSMKRVASLMPNLNSFIDHLTCSSRVDVPVTKDVFDVFTGSSFSSEDDAEDHRIIVSVVGGAPGSEKNSLSTLITSYNTHIFNWLVYKQPEECSINTNFLHRSMIEAVRSRNEWMDNKRTRVILVAPGFCDTSDVIREFFSHPDKKISSQFCIGSVTICIDPLNAFMDNKITLPCLTAQCAQGWVNNIVFTSQTMAPSNALDSIQNLIRSINPDVALLKAEKGEVKRSTDLDFVMSERSFEDQDKIKARALIKPFWQMGPSYSWPSQPAVNDVVIKFNHPLEKHLLLIKLRGIKASHQGFPFEGNIYFVRGFLAFTSSPVLVDIQFTPLSDKLIMTDTRKEVRENRKLYIMSFTGVGLKDAAVKDFLSSCVKQKPEKKKFLRKEDLSKHEVEKLHAKHHLDDLPEGWYYNGTLFVSMSGERSYQHPNLDAMIEAYIAKKNSDISRYNQEVDSSTYVDLFP